MMLISIKLTTLLEKMKRAKYSQEQKINNFRVIGVDKNN